ncbi:hypothetical protein ACVPOY_11245 [Staphylococcus aureus]
MLHLNKINGYRDRTECQQLLYATGTRVSEIDTHPELDKCETHKWDLYAYLVKRR